MEQPGTQWLSSGREALDGGRWDDALHAFTMALAEVESPEALAGLGEAQWWLGDTRGAVDNLGRAYVGYLRRPEPERATLCALRLFLVCLNSLGRHAVARGWLRRAARLTEEYQLEAFEGWVGLLTGAASGDPARAADAARQASASATRFGDPDLELCARSQLGASLMQMGQLEEGTALLDEAMVGALAGEGQRLDTVVYTSCNTVTACCRVAELGRALQWIRAAAAFTERYGSPHVFTVCRTHHARLLFLAGDWVGAEDQYGQALRAGRDAEPALHGEALAGLAELRLAEGRRADAERLLRGLEGHSGAMPARAIALLAAGQPVAAIELLARRQREIELGLDPEVGVNAAGAAVCLERADLLALQAEAAVAAGRSRQALDVADALARLGEDSRCMSVTAAAALARGRALMAADEDDAKRHDALTSLESALALYTRLAMPLEVGRAQLLWARARAPEAPEAAAVASRAALVAFEDLGAGPDADLAASFLRELGVSAGRRGPRGIGLLTRREREVLELLSEGLPNRAIGERLHVSLKTVEYHVSNVLSKLGVRSRAEAASFGARHLHADGAIDDPLTT